MAGYRNGNGHSLSELERQAETTRAELANTVEELQSRVSPEALKRDAKEYMRSTSQSMLQNIETKARENPLAAVAVAAGLALPVWRIVSSLPAPLLLIGAGVAMAQRGNRTYSSGSSSGHPGRGFAEDVKARASDLGTQVSERVSDMGSRMKDSFSGTAESARGFAEDATARTGEAMLDASKQAREAVYRSRDTIAGMVERYPLAAGGAALLAGAFIASALPATRQENRLMGDASDEIRHRGQTLAEEGMEIAKDTAAEIYESSAPKVREEGLTPGTARSAVRDAMDKAGEAVEKFAAKAEEGRSRTTKSKRS